MNLLSICLFRFVIGPVWQSQINTTFFLALKKDVTQLYFIVADAILFEVVHCPCNPIENDEFVTLLKLLADNIFHTVRVVVQS